MTYIHAPVRVILQDRNEVRVEIDNSERVVPIPSGAQGLPGEPGFSPIVSVEPITGGNRVTITDADGDTTFDVMDGQQGEQGEPGEGVPTGGVTGQVLKKRSNTNYDTYWANESGGGVTSVNGQTGAVVLGADDVGALPDTTSIPSKTSDLTNDSGFVNATQAAAAAPVQSVDGRTGAVTTLSSTMPSPPGTATPGTADYAARADHVHAMPSASDVGAMSKWTLLWTNASPSSSFAAQTVQLNLSGYDMVGVFGYNDVNDGGVMAFAPVGESAALFFMYNYRQRRYFAVSSAGVQFKDGYSGSLNNSLSVSNTAAIPYYIFGIKGVQ